MRVSFFETWDQYYADEPMTGVVQGWVTVSNSVCAVVLTSDNRLRTVSMSVLNVLEA